MDSQYDSDGLSMSNNEKVNMSNTAPKTRRRRPKSAPSSNERAVPIAAEYYSKAVGRALEVLDYFLDSETHLSLTDLSRLSGFPESSLFRVLTTLESHRYLQRNADGSYRLAPKVLFGTLSERAERLREEVRPFLQQLNHRFDETVSLAFLFEDRIQVIDVVETFQMIRAGNVLGRILSPHCSSLAKAITAFQPPNRIERITQVYNLVRFTDQTIVDRLAILAEYEKIRGEGWAIDNEESVLGICCYGAPLLDGQGFAVAAVSVSSPKGRITPERERDIIHELRKTSKDTAPQIQALFPRAVRQ
jgi:DNA-binding IclR family transcriptional regulator